MKGLQYQKEPVPCLDYLLWISSFPLHLIIYKISQS